MTGRTGEVREYQGRRVFYVDGRPAAPMGYHLIGRCSSNPWEEDAQRHLRQFAEAGCRLFFCDVWLRDVWRADRTLDIAQVKRQMTSIAAVHPDAAVIIRLGTEAPGWWLEQNPVERIGFALQAGAEIPEAVRTKVAEYRRASFASRLWRDETAEAMCRLVGEVAASPEGRALVGVHVGGGEWGEWFYPGFEFEPDTGPAMRRHFREWLAEKYGTDAALQAAWADSAVTLQSAEIPDVAERFQTSERMFRDPTKEQKAIDYYKCHQELVADTPLEFCRRLREVFPRPLIVGIFHAYFFHLSHQAPGGHLEMHRVLESPHVDYLASPFSYEFDARYIGGSGHLRCLSETVRAHGKLWMSEIDHPTLVGDHFGRPWPFAPENIADSVATMRRNAAPVLTQGQGMWWYDFGPAGQNGAGGWWDHPELMAEAKRLHTLANQMLERPWRSEADVLIVYDTECFYHLGAMYLGFYNQSHHWCRTETLSFEAANRTVADAYRSGVAFDTLHINDLERISLERYKVIVFAFTPYLSARHTAAIRGCVLTPGRAVVWVYAPGYTDGKALSTERITAVTHVKVERIDTSLPPQLLLREGSLAPGFPETRIDCSIQDAWTGPVFHVVDEAAVSLGYYAGSRRVALARKSVNCVDTWYCAMPLRNPSVMREIFRAAGAHIYNQKNDALHVGGGLLCLHTETGGRRDITLRSGKKVVLELEPWSTQFVDMDSGDPVWDA